VHLQLLLAVVVTCVAIAVAFEGSDSSEMLVDKLTGAQEASGAVQVENDDTLIDVPDMGDMSLPLRPANLVLLQDAAGLLSVTDTDAQAGNATLAADETKSKAGEVENEVQRQATEAQDVIAADKAKATATEDEFKKTEAAKKLAEEQEQREATEAQRKKAAKDEAKRHLDDLKAEAARDGVAVTSVSTVVKNAKAKVEKEKREIEKATSDAQEAKDKFETAKSDFDRKQHKLELLTGVAHKDETFEQYQARKKREALNKARGATHALGDAEAAANRADQAAAEAEAEHEKSRAKAKLLAGQADAKESEAKRLEKALAEAMAKGEDVTQLLAAAKKARSEADSAASELAAEKVKLDHLADKKNKAQAHREKTKLKSQALRKLKGAEESLVQDMKNKAEQAKNDLANQKSGLTQREMDEQKARTEEEEAKRKLAAASSAMAGTKAKLHNTDVKLKTVDGQVVSDRKVHIDLSNQMNSAAQISIPENTPVEEAKNMLEDKERKLREFTQKLMAALQAQKKHMTEQHVLQKKKVDDTQKIAVVQEKVVEASGQAAEAEAKLGNATNAVKDTQAAVTAAKTNVTKDEHAAASAEDNLQNVEEKENKADQENTEAKAELNKDDAELSAVESKTKAAMDKAQDAGAALAVVENTPAPNITETPTEQLDSAYDFVVARDNSLVSDSILID